MTNSSLESNYGKGINIAETSSNTDSYDAFYSLLNRLGVLETGCAKGEELGDKCSDINDTSANVHVSFMSSHRRVWAKRVILFGNSKSGKRTLCRHLRQVALMTQECVKERIRKAMLENDDDDYNNRNAHFADIACEKSVALSLTNSQLRQPLYNPYNSNSANIIDLSDKSTADYNRNDVFSASNQKEQQETPIITTNATSTKNIDNNFKDFDNSNNNNINECIIVSSSKESSLRGIGLAQNYIKNYYWFNLSDKESNHKETIEEFEHNNANIERIMECDIEFLCCDHIACLRTALPDADMLEDVLLLMVVDMSKVEGVLEQIRSLYRLVEEHVIDLIREKESYNYAARLHELKQKRYEECVTTEVECASGQKISHNTSVVIARLETMCPIRSILVCTHIDMLESAEINEAGEIHNIEDVYEHDRNSVQTEMSNMEKLVNTKKKMPDAIQTILNVNAVSLSEIVRQVICTEGVQRSLAVLCIDRSFYRSTHIDNNNEISNEEKQPFVYQLWRCIAEVLTPLTYTKKTVAMSSFWQFLHKLKQMTENHNVWLAFANEYVANTFRKMTENVDGVNGNNNIDNITLSEQENNVIRQYLLGQFSISNKASSVHSNASLNIVTHRKLIETIEHVLASNSENNTKQDKSCNQYDKVTRASSGNTSLYLNTNKHSLSPSPSHDMTLADNNNSNNNDIRDVSKSKKSIDKNDTEQFIWDVI